MDYSFNGEIAKIYGVDEAVFIHNLYWWIAKNQANGRHFYDGKSWTYNSMSAFTELFPFWTINQVRHIIQKLINDGVVFVGNYNKNALDRTQWYALNNDVLAVYRNDKIECQKAQMQVGNFPNASERNDTPIPDIKQKKEKIYKKEKKVGDSEEQGRTESKNNNKPFQPPQLEEVQSYCKERNNDISAQMFLDHYQAKGWMIGRNKMKDWKAAVRTWEHSRSDNQKISTLKKLSDGEFQI